MTNEKKVNTLLVTLKRCEYELSEMLKTSPNHNVQYVRALNAEYNAETNSLDAVLSELDYNPTLMPWPSCLSTIWSNKTEPNRAPNSLPRYSGHILSPQEYAAEVFGLVQEINSLKSDIAANAKALHETYGEGKKSRITDTLQRLGVFDETENFQVTTRRLLCTDLKTPLEAITIDWLKNPSSTDFKGDLTKAKATLNPVTHGYILDALSEYNRARPNSIFLRRFYSPPTIFGKIKIGGEWNNKPFAISTPFIIVNAREKAKFKTRLDKLEVQLFNGNIRSVEAIKKASSGKVRGTKLQPITNLPNWYVAE